MEAGILFGVIVIGILYLARRAPDPPIEMEITRTIRPLRKSVMKPKATQTAPNSPMESDSSSSFEFKIEKSFYSFKTPDAESRSVAQKDRPRRPVQRSKSRPPNKKRNTLHQQRKFNSTSRKTAEQLSLLPSKSQLD